MLIGRSRKPHLIYLHEILNFLSFFFNPRRRRKKKRCIVILAPSPLQLRNRNNCYVWAPRMAKVTEEIHALHPWKNKRGGGSDTNTSVQKHVVLKEPSLWRHAKPIQISLPVSLTFIFGTLSPGVENRLSSIPLSLPNRSESLASSPAAATPACNVSMYFCGEGKEMNGFNLKDQCFIS